ncbi:hypothetical protein BU15DRAFT_80966 [Melanogaster broomeanus]|nr:hypothetical protein BU15DRAFT_80966 [Melanogaster broomeanus]
MANNTETVLVPLNLGSAANYDSTLFPLARLKAKGSIHTGHLFLQLTLEEMLKIYELSKNLNSESTRELLQQASDAYNALMRQKVTLEQQQKSINPFKLYAVHREKKLFIEAGWELYKSTKTKSETMQRVLPVPSADVPQVQADSIAIHEQVAGFSVTTTEEAAAPLGSLTEPPHNSSAEHSHSGGRDVPISTGETVDSGTIPSSTNTATYINICMTISHYNYNNSVHNSNSTASGLTVNSGGSGNSGSSIHNSPVENPPS